MNWILHLIFKHPNIELEFQNAPLMVQFVVLRFVELSVTMYGIQPVITRILDPVAGESGVHNQYRAADVRNEFMGIHMYTKEQSDTLVMLINQEFRRIDGFETVIMHSFKGNPAHFHFQTPHESIKMRGPLYASN